jgi:NAD(P)-dependent dehydrogenase (short-subunit alcohol dehydrogenase family)
MPVTYDFHNQIAIVIGGAKGIGRSIAERLRDAGAKVVVWDLHEPDFEGVSFAARDAARRQKRSMFSRIVLLPWRARVEMPKASGRLAVVIADLR